MPTYKPYAKVADTPNRLTRKQQRKTVFIYNKKLTAKLQKERRLAKKAVLDAAREALEEGVEE